MYYLEDVIVNMTLHYCLNANILWCPSDNILQDQSSFFVKILCNFPLTKKIIYLSKYTAGIISYLVHLFDVLEESGKVDNNLCLLGAKHSFELLHL